MAHFEYSALDGNGAMLKGTVEAVSLSIAQDILDHRELMPVEIKKIEQRKKRSFQFGGVKSLDLILFTRQFEVMVRAGVPMIRLIKTLKEQSDNRKMQDVTQAILDDVEAGVDLSAAVAKHPSVFSNLYASMLKAGESSGSLDRILARLTYIIEHEDKIKKDIKSAMVYPVTVISFLIATFIIILTYVMPKFVTMFEQARIKLPWQTQLCIDLSNFIVDNRVIIPAVLSAIVAACILYIKTPAGRYTWDYTLLKLPLVGNVLSKSIMSRFASVFSILISSGLPILSSLEILHDTLSNKVLGRAFDTISDDLRKGEGIAEPLRQSGLFPPLMCNIVAIGEETGQLDELLQDVSKHYDIEVELAMKRVVEAIPTILTIGLAVLVGFFAMAIYLPMFEIITSRGGH